MILLIDAGNTRAKFAWLDDDPGAHRTAPQPLDYADPLRLIREAPQPPQRILGSKVAGHEAIGPLEQACRKHWGLAIEWKDARDGAELLHNPYARPGQLGPDRWLALLGLQQHIAHDPDWAAGTPYILASFGTATTVDTLQRRAAGQQPPATFLGGLILPGVTLMAQSLATGTARLPLATGPCQDFPTDTHSAIASGIAAAQSGALLRQWRLAWRIAGRTPCTYVSGGGWPAVRDDVSQTLANAQADLGLPRRLPQWLDAPVLDGLAWLDQQVNRRG
jgi:type III pantothenate kinase